MIFYLQSREELERAKEEVTILQSDDQIAEPSTSCTSSGTASSLVSLGSLEISDSCQKPIV